MTRSWPALVAVAVSGAALALAGRAGLPAEQRAGVGAPVEVGRTLVCPGGLPGASRHSGVSALEATRGGRVQVEPLPESPDPAPQIEAEAQAAAGTFATQVARGARWLAMVPCPEPRADWWFVGVGASQAHASTLRIANPRDGDAVVDVEVLGPRGPVAVPGAQGLVVRAGSTRVLELPEVAAAVGDLAVRVTTSRGLVSVVAADSYAPDLVTAPVREWVAPQPAAARSLLLAGLPAKPSAALLLVANPAEVEALVKVQVVGERGTFDPPSDATVRVPAGGTVGVPITEVFDGRPLALRLTSARRISATVRSVSAGDIAHAGAAGPLADGSSLAVPEGVVAQVQVSATTAGSVQVDSFDATGRRLGSRPLEVAGASTTASALPPGTRHVVLRSTSEGLTAALVVEGRSGGRRSPATGLASAVFEAAVQAVRPPEVRPG